MSIATTSDNELRDLYRHLILDHARKPRHFGELPSATHSAAGINPLCGDKLQLFLKVDQDGRIGQAQFAGSGCAISMASASLLTEAVNGLHRDAALDIMAALTSQLAGGASARANDRVHDLGKLAALRGVREFPSRVKCATLAWQALRSALAGNQQTANTEQLTDQEYE